MHESEKWKWSHWVVSDSSRPRGLQPTRLLHPWDFPGKSPGVGCHCLIRPPPLTRGNYYSNFQQHRLILHVCNFHVNGTLLYALFCFWLLYLNIISMRSIHVMVSRSFHCCIVFYCMVITQFICLFACFFFLTFYLCIWLHRVLAVAGESSLQHGYFVWHMGFVATWHVES